MIATLVKNRGMIAIAVAMFQPFLFMTGASVKRHSEVERPGMLPEIWQPQNYGVVLRQTPDHFWVSSLTSISRVGISTVCSWPRG